MISIRNISKSFGNNHVIKNLSLEISKGERVVVLGPSGCGKSTFLRCINFLEPITGGEIYFHNQLVTTKNAEAVRQKIGLVFQQFNLFNNLTVLENLTLAPTELGLLTPTGAKRKAMRLLRHFDLQDKASAYPPVSLVAKNNALPSFVP